MKATTKIGYKFPYVDHVGTDLFVNPKKLVQKVERYLKGDYGGDEARKSDVFLIYYHGHGADVLGKQCIVDGDGKYIPIYELVSLVYKIVRPLVIYLVMDCCSDYIDSSVEAETRVKAVFKLQDRADFEDILVCVSASKPGMTASGKKGETLTALALLPVLKECDEKGHFSLNHELDCKLNTLYASKCRVTPGAKVKNRKFPV